MKAYYVLSSPLLLFTVFLLNLTINIHSLEVDVYLDMASGEDGALLTSSIMNSSIHGGVNNIDGIGRVGGKLWVSTTKARELPGIITVNGENYSGSSPYTWKFSDKYENNYGVVLFGDTPRQDPYPPYHIRMTVACFLTPGQIERFWNNHDVIATGGPKGYAVLQVIGSESNNPHIRAHSCKEGDVTTHSPGIIKVVAGKTYWVNLHHNGDEGKCKVAVFDPGNGWKQVGKTVVAESIQGSKNRSRIRFGRCDKHGDNNAWDTETNSYISHILIDYTNGVFPLLPDINGEDNIPPIPDPMTWVDLPKATGPTSVTMTATTATDQNGVEYFFECISGGGNNSGWQDSPYYTDIGLMANSTYIYQVQARDKSVNQNETAFSSTASVTTPLTDILDGD